MQPLEVEQSAWIFHHLYQMYGKAEYYRCNAISLSLIIHSIPPIFVPALIRASNKTMAK